MLWRILHKLRGANIQPWLGHLNLKQLQLTVDLAFCLQNKLAFAFRVISRFLGSFFLGIIVKPEKESSSSSNIAYKKVRKS